jgi:hypothetical protein
MIIISMTGTSFAVIETVNTEVAWKAVIVAMATNTGAKAVKAAEAKKASVAEAMAVATKAPLEEVRAGVAEVN